MEPNTDLLRKGSTLRLAPKLKQGPLLTLKGAAQIWREIPKTLGKLVQQSHPEKGRSCKKNLGRETLSPLKDGHPSEPWALCVKAVTAWESIHISDSRPQD